MDEYQSLNHTKWDCKYHVVFIPKCRRRVLYVQLRQHLGEVFKQLAAQRECRIDEGHLMSDHVHMMISIPPQYSVSQVVGYIKGQERDSSGAGVCRTETKFCWTALLGPRILRLDPGSRRSSDP
jgi:REP element-mobilizing transposase RayT